MALEPILDVLGPIVRADEGDNQIGLELRNDLECGEMIRGAQPRHAGIDYFGRFSLLRDTLLHAMSPGRLIVKEDVFCRGTANRADA